MRLLLTGGKARSDAHRRGEGRRYEAARLVRLDWSRGTLDELINYVGDGAHYPEETPNRIFTSGPKSTSPASIVFRISYSCRARRLVAMTLSMRPPA